MHHPTTDALVDSILNGMNAELSDRMQGEVVFLDCPMAQPWDDHFRVAVEKRTNGNMQPRLIVVLQTNGGYIETVERLVRVCRSHFEEVFFVIPSYAYSAGTVLALSGDEIYMDYHSVLGPIDPQFSTQNGEFMPGMGYVAKYKELVNTINQATSPSDVRAEIAFLVEKFDPARLFHLEQAIEHSKTLLRKWLPKYKFKNWTNRSTSGAPVTDTDKQNRANEIAEALGDAAKWHSHGRGITCDDLDNEEIKLKINNYGLQSELRRAIRNYHGLLEDYMGRRGWQAAIHTRDGFGAFQ
jgi:hypothetical protein